MKERECECPLNVWFEEEEQFTGTTWTNEHGTVIGESKPIKLTCPIQITNGELVTHVGGWWWVKFDRDNSTRGIHKKMFKIDDHL